MKPLKTAADVFGLSYYHVRQLALSGKISAVRAGAEGSRGKILVNIDSLSAYLSRARLCEKENIQIVKHGIRQQSV